MDFTNVPLLNSIYLKGLLKAKGQIADASERYIEVLDRLSASRPPYKVQWPPKSFLLKLSYLDMPSQSELSQVKHTFYEFACKNLQNPIDPQQLQPV